MIERDNRVLKASFRECPIADRKRFFQSSCIIPISVGQPVHEGKKFVAVMKLINSSFKSCTLLIDDSVQWHTLGIIHSSKSRAQLYELAVNEGEDWLKRNELGYKTLTIPYNIMRWDEWLLSSNYKASFSNVIKFYYENESYRNAIHTNIGNFLSRFLTRLTDQDKIDYDRAFSLCREYLWEECAVMCLWVNNRYEFEVYPSGRNEAMGATYEYLIKPFYPDLLKPVALRFKKYSSNILEKQKPTVFNIMQLRE